MNDKTIFGGLDPELLERVTSRRNAVNRTGKMAGAVALASMPVMFGLMAKKAFAQAGGLPQDIINVLNFALTLEYLENDYYQTGLGTGGLIPAADRPVFEPIAAHEAAHVALLEGVLGANKIQKPTFDFTAGGALDPFGDYATFQALAQGFEDAGVRAYKGQATALMANDDILTTALQIHSVEARHASAVRRLRGQKGWITGNQTDVAQLQPIYAGEEAANGSATSPQATEAFDEPLTMDQVLTVATLFIVP